MLKYLEKFFYVLGKKKKEVVFLLASFLFVSLLEVFGIGLIGPFLNLASEPSLVHKNFLLERTYKTLRLANESQLVILIGIATVVVFLIKSLISWRVKTYTFRFVFSQKGELSTRMFRLYVDAPFTFHLSQNSAYIINAITDYTQIFCQSVLMPFVGLLSNTIVIVCIAVLLCITNVVAVVAILSTLLPLFLVFNCFKEKIRNWGKTLSESKEAVIRTVNHGVGGIKETKVIGCSSYFESQLEENVNKFEEAATQFFSFKMLPRIVSETMLVVFMIGFTTAYISVRGNIQQLISVLSIFALASIRLIPEMSNLIGHLSKLKNSSYVLNKLYLDLKELETRKVDKPSFVSTLKTSELENDFCSTKSIATDLRNEINLDSISYRYPQASENSLEHVSLSIKKGQSIALIGRSGAGKTTLVDVILGLLVPNSGDILVDNQSIYSDLRSWQNLIGYIPQSIFLTDDTIERNIAFGVPDYSIDEQKLRKAIQAAQLEELVEELPDGVKTKVGERGIRLSGGQRQRIGIARVIYHEREILILDEATSALDNETESLVTESIKSLSGSKTIIIIAHRLTTVEHCDRVYLMEKGRIVKSGSYQEVVLGENMAVT